MYKLQCWPSKVILKSFAKQKHETLSFLFKPKKSKCVDKTQNSRRRRHNSRSSRKGFTPLQRRRITISLVAMTMRKAGTNAMTWKMGKFSDSAKQKWCSFFPQILLDTLLCLSVKICYRVLQRILTLKMLSIKKIKIVVSWE